MEFYNFLLKADISPDLRENIFRELVKRYSESHRAYHNIKHINESLSLLDKIPLKNKLAGFFAVVFHDAIYSPKEKDNEEKSAELADKFLEGYSAGFRKIVRQNILATKHNLKAKSLDSKLIADIDLTILASDAGMYREYVAGVLKEYAPFYSKEQLKEGRRKFIAGMLGRKIFQTEYFKEYEKKAKNNLLKELKSQE